ncbi:MAG: hypothetical protein ACKOA2_00165 [Ilumatobacteraceae bacterium]
MKGTHTTTPKGASTARYLPLRPSGDDPDTQYAVVLFRHVVRLHARRRPHDADDVAATVVEEFLNHDPETRLSIMAEHPDAAKYAQLVTFRAGIDHDRRQRVQRCEGVRLTPLADGGLTTGRTWTSGDAAPSGGAALFERVIDDDIPIDDEVTHRLAVSRLADEILCDLDDDDRRLLTRIDGLGHAVNDVAAEIGVRRETLSRRVNRLRAVVRDKAAANAGAALADVITRAPVP